MPLLLDASQCFHSVQIITILDQCILTITILSCKSKQWKKKITTENSSTTFPVVCKSGPLYWEQISQISVENIRNIESFYLFKNLGFNITHLLWTNFHLSNLGSDFWADGSAKKPEPWLRCITLRHISNFVEKSKNRIKELHKQKKVGGGGVYV